MLSAGMAVHEHQPRTARAFIICAPEAIEQSLELSFQTVFAGTTKIRHRGSEESVDAVRRQFSEWVADRFGQLTFLIKVTEA